ncbi:MAG: DUF1501 domain-containing protein, partial [Acidobacteriota bacterium]
RRHQAKAVEAAPQDDQDQGVAGAGSGDALILIVLRGGFDGLGLVAPISGDDHRFYRSARPTLGLGTDRLLALDGRFGLHPAAEALHGLYSRGRLAIIPAAGTVDRYAAPGAALASIQRGGDGLDTGWLTRHLASAPGRAEETYVPALTRGAETSALLGSLEHLPLPAGDDLDLGLVEALGPDGMTALAALHQGDDGLHATGRQTLSAIEIGAWLEGEAAYRPAAGARYPTGDFGDALQRTAQMIRLDLGLEAAAIELDGFDLRSDQGPRFADRVALLSEGLGALHRDLEGCGASGRVTVVVMSEMGRTIEENASRGTDPGHGTAMLVLGDAVHGGVHGVWPGLAPDRRSGGGLAVTTDYRQVLSEVLIRRGGNPNLGRVFPGFEGYDPLGLVHG